jgi:hypothetical protein
MGLFKKLKKAFKKVTGAVKKVVKKVVKGVKKVVSNCCCSRSHGRGSPYCIWRNRCFSF